MSTLSQEAWLYYTDILLAFPGPVDNSIITF